MTKEQVSNSRLFILAHGGKRHTPLTGATWHLAYALTLKAAYGSQAAAETYLREVRRVQAVTVLTGCVVEAL